MTNTTGAATDAREAHEANMSMLKRAKDAVDTLRETADKLLRPVENAFDTVTGKKSHEMVASYLQEHEAINTALATRIYDLLDRARSMSERLSKAERRISTVTALVIVSIGLNVCLLLAVIYLGLR